MKKLLLIILCIFAFHLCNAQSKWSIGLTFQAGKSGLMNPVLNGFPDADSIDAYQGSDYSFTIKEPVIYQINDRISVQSGITFSKMKFNWQKRKEYFTPDAMAEYTKYDVSEGWQMNSYKGSFYFIGIPLIVNFRIITSNKFDFYLSTGLSFNYLFGFQYNGSSYFIYKTYTSKSDIIFNIDKFKMFHYELHIGTGFTFKLTNNFKLLIEPSFAYDFNNMCYPKSDGMDGNLLNIGINLGFIYNFK
jgi:hypothetical protein